ncbi:MAG TPA: response regulator [Xanthobacteraceae bacterium]|jgi:two-component system OmpR family response regulator|nr:response regulator [Xanthobacteraceae bacterium]
MRILVVEDDKRLGPEIVAVLRRAGYAVDLSSSGEEAAFLGETEPYDAIVLDLGLPDRDGLTVLTQWRAKSVVTPVLVLTARDRFADLVAGFRSGADDYLKKPFQIDELVVRLAALIRRSQRSPAGVTNFGSLAFDTTTGAISLDGLPLALTSLEARILRYLVQKQGSLVSRIELADHIYERDTDRGLNSLEVVISRIRRKIGNNKIVAVRGEGYRLERNPEK